MKTLYIRFYQDLENPKKYFTHFWGTDNEGWIYYEERGTHTLPELIEVMNYHLNISSKYYDSIAFTIQQEQQFLKLEEQYNATK